MTTVAEHLRTERFSLADGTSIPKVGFGTWMLTGDVCTHMIHSALQLGYRHIDTAQIYENQMEVGKGLIGVPREELYLTSKLWMGDDHPDKVAKATERILEELNTPYLDLLLIHWPSRDVSFAQTLEAMQHMQDLGYTKSLGVSNFTIPLLQKVLASGVQIVMNQVEFHPYLFQRELLEFCTMNDIRLTAYSPIARGRVLKEKALIEIGQAHHRSPAQVALRWLVQHGLVVIPKSSSRERAMENGDIFSFALSEKEMHQIDELNQNRRLINPEWAPFDWT